MRAQVLHDGELVSDGIVKALKAAPKNPDAQPELTREVHTALHTHRQTA